MHRLVAEEVAQVYPELVAYGDDGRPQSVAYQMLPAMLLNEIQKQARENRRKDAQIAALQKQIDGRESDHRRNQTTSGTAGSNPAPPLFLGLPFSFLLVPISARVIICAGQPLRGGLFYPPSADRRRRRRAMSERIAYALLLGFVFGEVANESSACISD
jgi:hypothetical protein